MLRSCLYFDGNAALICFFARNYAKMECIYFLKVYNFLDFLIAFRTGVWRFWLIKSYVFQSLNIPSGAMTASMNLRLPLILLMLSQVTSNRPFFRQSLEAAKAAAVKSQLQLPIPAKAHILCAKNSCKINISCVFRQLSVHFMVVFNWLYYSNF